MIKIYKIICVLIIINTLSIIYLKAQTENFIVINSESSGEGSLSDAIFKANDSAADSVNIFFDIDLSSETLPITIELNEFLISDPAFYDIFRDKMRIDGSTQEGYLTDAPAIVIQRTEQLDTIGMAILGNNVSINGIQFNDFETALEIYDVENVNITNNIFNNKNTFPDFIISESGPVQVGESEVTIGVLYGNEDVSVSNSLTFQGNRINGFNRGLQIDGGVLHSVVNNLFYDNRRSCILRNIENAIIADNQFDNSFAEEVHISEHLSGLKVEEACSNIIIHNNLFFGYAITPEPGLENNGILLNFSGTGGVEQPENIFIYDNCFGLSDCNLTADEHIPLNNIQAYAKAINLRIGENIYIGIDEEGNNNGNLIAGSRIGIELRDNINTHLIKNNAFYCCETMINNEVFASEILSVPEITSISANTQNSILTLTGIGTPNSNIQIFGVNYTFCNTYDCNANSLVGETTTDALGDWSLNVFNQGDFDAFVSVASIDDDENPEMSTSDFSNCISVNECLEAVCVWSGDTDDNGVVNNKDLLAIGLNFGDTGLARAEESIAWEAQECDYWNEGDFPDKCFSDCNGDGIVDESDIEAVNENYFKSSIVSPDNLSSNNNGTISIKPFTQDTIVEGEVLDITIGFESDIPVDVYAFAFAVNFTLADPILIIKMVGLENAAEIPFINYDDSGIGTIGENLIGIDKIYYDTIPNLPNHTYWDVALSRTDKQDINTDSELLCTMTCIMEVGSIEKRAAFFDVQISIEDIVIIGANGKFFNAETESITTTLSSAYTNSNNILKEEFDCFSIENGILSTKIPSEITIFDLKGNVVFKFNKEQILENDLSLLKNGIYLVYNESLDCVEKVQIIN